MTRARILADYVSSGDELALKAPLISPALVTPNLGTPSAGTMTNMTGAVTASIVDDAVTLAKMAGGTDGNLITYDTSGDPAYVATGTSGHVLTSAGANAVPAFGAVPGVAVVKLYSVTPGSVSIVQINGYFDDSIYGQYKLVYYGIQSGANGVPTLQVMVGGSPDTGSHYWSLAFGMYGLNGTGAEENTAQSDGGTSSKLNTGWNYPDDGNDATFDGEIVFSNPQASDKWKQFNWSFGQGSAGTESDHYYVRGTGLTVFRANDVLTGLSLTNPAGNSVTAGTYILYGYKK